MRTFFTLLLLAMFSLIGLSGQAYAVNCNVAATGVNFGGYDVFSSVPRDSTGTITITCNNPDKSDKNNPKDDTLVEVSLSPGNSGSFSPRRMTSASGDTLSYNLYTTPFSTIWGDGAGSSSVTTGFVNKDMPLNLTIYGRIPARQNVRAGSYSDTITVTVIY